MAKLIVVAWFALTVTDFSQVLASVKTAHWTRAAKRVPQQHLAYTFINQPSKMFKENPTIMRLFI
jgi:hypothetical protein